MTYETGTAVDLEDLLSKLNTFAVTTHGGGWAGYSTNPDATNGWFELHKGSLSFSAKYPVGETPVHMSAHQATGFVNDSTAPGKHTADSGNGYNAGDTGHTNANLDDERHVSDIGDGPFPTYRFFADDSPDYIHVAVEAETGRFRHFGFGNLEKLGDNWTGGEYVFAQFHDSSTSASPTLASHTCLLDALTTTADRAATLRIGGLANIGAAVWGVSAGIVSASLGTDTAGNVRRQIHGGYRGGVTAKGLGSIIGTNSSGVVGLYPITAWYRDPNNARVQYLGHMPDVRGFNIRNFEPGEELVIGTDTWVLLPLSTKTLASVAGRSLYSGIAYKKVA